MNLELYSRIFKNIRRVDLLIVVSFLVSVSVFIIKMMDGAYSARAGAFQVGILIWLVATLIMILLLEVVSFILFLKATKNEFKFNLKKSLKLYMSDVFLFNYKNDKSSKVLNIFVYLFIVIFVIFTLGVFVSNFLSSIKSNQQQEITNAEIEVVEQFREINDNRLDE